MSQAELNALVEILNRTPVSGAERLWLQTLFAREYARLRENNND